MLYLSASTDINKAGYINFLHHMKEIYPSAATLFDDHEVQVAQIEDGDFSLLKDLVEQEIDLQNQLNDSMDQGKFQECDEIQKQLTETRETINETLNRMRQRRFIPSLPLSSIDRAHKLQRLTDDPLYDNEEGDIPPETDDQRTLPAKERYFARLEVLRNFFREKLEDNPRLFNGISAKINELHALFHDGFIPPVNDFQRVIKALDNVLIKFSMYQSIARLMETRDLTDEEEGNLKQLANVIAALESELLLDLKDGGRFERRPSQNPREAPLLRRRALSPPPVRSEQRVPEEEHRTQSVESNVLEASSKPPIVPKTKRENIETDIQDVKKKLETAQGIGKISLESRLRRLEEDLNSLEEK